MGTKDKAVEGLTGLWKSWKEQPKATGRQGRLNSGINHFLKKGNEVVVRVVENQGNQEEIHVRGGSRGNNDLFVTEHGRVDVQKTGRGGERSHRIYNPGRVVDMTFVPRQNRKA